MEELNFINKKDSKKDKKIKIYLKSLIIILIILIIIFTILTTIKRNKLKNITENIKKINLSITNKNISEDIIASLKNEDLELKKEIEIINNLKKTPKKEFDIVLNIYKIFNKQVDLHEININQDEFIISAETQDEKIANKITKKISKLRNIKTAYLASMQKNNNKFIFQIKGKIKQ